MLVHQVHQLTKMDNVKSNHVFLSCSPVAKGIIIEEFFYFISFLGLSLRRTKTSARRGKSWLRIRNTKLRKPSICLTPIKTSLLTTTSWRWEMRNAKTGWFLLNATCFWNSSVPSQQVAMRALGFEVRKVDVLKILKDYDREGKGKITFEDFSEVGKLKICHI